MLGRTMVMARIRRGGPGALPAAYATLIVVVDDIAYLALVAGQGTGLGGRVVFVATLLLAAAGMIMAGVQQRNRVVRTLLLSAVATWGLVIGVVGIFSIGLPLLVAAGLVIYALVTGGVSQRALIAGVAVGLVLLFFGFIVTAG